jgi:hypothetical protein
MGNILSLLEPKSPVPTFPPAPLPLRSGPTSPHIVPLLLTAHRFIRVGAAFYSEQAQRAVSRATSACRRGYRDAHPKEKAPRAAGQVRMISGRQPQPVGRHNTLPPLAPRVYRAGAREPERNGAAREAALIRRIRCTFNPASAPRQRVCRARGDCTDEPKVGSCNPAPAYDGNPNPDEYDG